MITYKQYIKPLDIIVVYNKKSWLHRLIFRVTDYKAGHVAIYLGGELIVEANSKGVHYKTWKNYNDDCRVWLVRYLGMSGKKDLAIRKYCFEAQNTKYSFLQLVALFLKYTFKLSHVPDVSKKAMVCSEFVAAAFKSAGISLVNLEPHETTPEMILNSDNVTLVPGWNYL